MKRIFDDSVAGGLAEPALLGSLRGAAMVLKNFGGRWDRTDGVFHFANWASLEAALQHFVEERKQVTKAEQGVIGIRGFKRFVRLAGR